MRFTNNFLVEECSIPEGMTLQEWRRSQARQRRTLRDRAHQIRRQESERAEPARPTGER